MTREVRLPGWRTWLVAITATWIALGGVGAGATRPAVYKPPPVAPAGVASPEPSRQWDGRGATVAGERQPLGLFVHYGPSTLVNAKTAVGWWREMTYGHYDRAVARFHPSASVADGWIDLARRAGAAYIAITAKHHDGYTLWHSATTSYGVSAERDIIARAALDARREGIGLVVYFSLIDLHAPSYKDDWPAYERLVRAQLRELMTRYGRIAGVWFDGPGWERTGKSFATWRLPELYALIHHYQPSAQIVTNHHFGRPLPGEGALTFESTMPTAPAPWPQQAAFTISPQWFYSTRDPLPMTHRQYLALKAQARMRSASLLINVPPMADGSFDPAYVRALLG
ncbi:MAG: alpha-L-fucosidase [Chloroflexota bacterium]|nr:alpha-L-fucosidase [Chloroflexota bacterium]